VLFTARADVDVHYVTFGGLGRTTNKAIDNTTFNSSGQVTHVGSNEANRNAVTFLHLIGPTSPQADGYQYTFAGNVVTCPLNPMPFIWGINVTSSYYGLIQNNVLVNWDGAGVFVNSDASYNTFDHNFVMRVTGTSSRPDGALQGDGYWFGNPNNYVTNNVATDINGSAWDVYSYGFDIDASYVGTVKVPASQGADPSVAGQSKSVNMNDTPILAFSGNEIYGATPSGLTLWWIGTFGDTPYADAGVSTVKDFVAWNFSSKGIYGYPTNNLVIDGVVIRGNASALSNGYEYVTGIKFDDYMTHNLVIRNADIQGMASGIEAPMMVGRTLTMDTTLIENSYLANTVNISLSPARSVNGSSGLEPMTLYINNVTFAHPKTAPTSWWYDVSMYRVTSDSLGTSNFSIPQFVYVNDYNGVVGDDFQVFYADSAPAGTTTRSLIGGKVKAL